MLSSPEFSVLSSPAFSALTSPVYSVIDDICVRCVEPFQQLNVFPQNSNVAELVPGPQLASQHAISSQYLCLRHTWFHDPPTPQIRLSRLGIGLAICFRLEHAADGVYLLLLRNV